MAPSAAAGASADAQLLELARASGLEVSPEMLAVVLELLRLDVTPQVRARAAAACQKRHKSARPKMSAAAVSVRLLLPRLCAPLVRQARARRCVCVWACARA